MIFTWKRLNLTERPNKYFHLLFRPLLVIPRLPYILIDNNDDTLYICHVDNGNQKYMQREGRLALNK